MLERIRTVLDGGMGKQREQDCRCLLYTYKVELKGSFCMGHCAEEGVCVKFDDQVYSLTLDTVDGFFASKVVARQESR